LKAGLADYEVRHWIGWHHHQTLSLITTRYLTVETRRAENKVLAITLPPLRRGIASIHRAELQCDSLPRVTAQIQHRLRRNQQARLDHWKRHNTTPPRNLERRRF